MENYTDIINKLNNINFTKRDGDKFISEDGFVFMWDIKIHTSLHENPLQLVVNILYKKTRISFWGCCSKEDTQAFAMFIETTKGKVYSYEHEQEVKDKQIGKAIFNSL
jgi:hypothetical protein